MVLLERRRLKGRGWREQSCPGRGWEFVAPAAGRGESGSPNLSRLRPRLPARSRRSVSPAVSAGAHGGPFGARRSGVYVYMYLYIRLYNFVQPADLKLGSWAASPACWGEQSFGSDDRGLGRSGAGRGACSAAAPRTPRRRAGLPPPRRRRRRRSRGEPGATRRPSAEGNTLIKPRGEQLSLPQ